MLSEITLLCLVASSLGEPTIAGIDRTMSEGMTSMGYNVIYGDEDLTMFNAVQDQVEKRAMNAKIRLNELIQPLPVIDVKCLMSADHYCSKEMKEMKGVIIQAIKDDCKTCTAAQKEGAGKVIAAMMAHDPASWKLFLTRLALLLKEKKREKIHVSPDTEQSKYRAVGEPEDVTNVRSKRFLLPGAK
uniref:Chemosensory protein CSP14 n=1 Tax=Lobesia botrana TaxID=209534 RepID=A0A345BEN7_9NEOP|nr:chemosensory protein CSP14 [Lobesia botrana]